MIITPQLILYCAIAIASLIFVANRWFSEAYQRKYRHKGHGWQSIQWTKSIPFNNVCSVCGRLMLSAVGEFCERCSLSACRECVKAAEKKRSCRVVSAPPDAPFYHNWVKVGTSCDDCHTLSEDLGKDFFCCWCQRVLHCDNGEPPKEVCDFGKLQLQIIQPTWVKIGRAGSIKITAPTDVDSQPIFIIGNPTSGGGTGEEIISLFRGLLNPIQIIRLNKKSLQSLLNWIPINSRIVVAGGDGSVAGVLTAIANKRFENSPPVGILPLGTGNDLSRVLGWGGCCLTPFSPLSYLNDIKTASVKHIDRWQVRIGRRQLYAYNYISIGVDARVALDFHRARLHPLYVKGSQWLNYLIYLGLGTQQVLSQDCSDLEELLDVYLDGVLITPPRLQALLLLNIPSWGAGVNVWNAGADTHVPEQKMNDGILEILGINSSFHIAQLQIGLSQPNRIGRATRVMIKLKGLAPMQVDGEPWEQTPCEIHVEKVGTVAVLEKC